MLGFQLFKRGFVLWAIACVFWVSSEVFVDNRAFWSMLRKRGERPNFCYELIYIINLGLLWNYNIELGIMKLAHYVVEWWSWT